MALVPSWQQPWPRCAGEMPGLVVVVVVVGVDILGGVLEGPEVVWGLLVVVDWKGGVLPRT